MTDRTVIFEFPNYYIEKNGSVFNKKGHVLYQHERKKYKYVYLYKNKKRYCVLVHRLVAKTFIPNPNMLPEVNHIDENPSNNNVYNLEWCDRKYNSNYGTLRSRIRDRMTKNNPFKNKHHTLETKLKISKKKKGQPSKRKREIYIHGVRYESVTKAMEILKISTRKLYNLIKE